MLKNFLTNQLDFFGISLIISSIILSGGIELLIYSSILLVIYLAFTIYKFRRVINLFQFKFFFFKSILLSVNLLLINALYFYPIKNFNEYTSRKKVPYDIYPNYEYRDLLSFLFRDMLITHSLFGIVVLLLVFLITT